MCSKFLWLASSSETHSELFTTDSQNKTEFYKTPPFCENQHHLPCLIRLLLFFGCVITESDTVRHSVTVFPPWKLTVTGLVLETRIAGSSHGCAGWETNKWNWRFKDDTSSHIWTLIIIFAACADVSVCVRVNGLTGHLGGSECVCVWGGGGGGGVVVMPAIWKRQWSRVIKTEQRREAPAP